MAKQQQEQQQLTREQAHSMLDELIAKFNTNEFQRKMRELWDGTSDYWQKVKLRQELCLEIQGPIISKYGYKATAAGVSRSSLHIINMMKKDADMAVKGSLNNWLVAHLEYSPLRQELDGTHVDDHAMQEARAQYKVALTDAEDAAAIRGLERCRASMVDFHQALYEPFYRGIRPNEWLEVLGQEAMRRSLEAGVVVLRAESLETGEVAGYISCSEGADDEQFIGSWASSSEPSQSHHIAKDKDGQLRVEGVFHAGSGSGALAPQGKWLEAKLVSSSDGRRVGVVRFCISGPGCMTVRFRGANETEWRRDCMALRAGGTGMVQDEGPHVKINHVAVLPGHHGRGVGRLLLEDLLAYLGKTSPAVSDLRLSVVEQNLRALSWYLKLGFSIVKLSLAHISTLKLGHVPVVFLNMQRRRSASVLPWERLFGREVCGEKVLVIPEYAPMLFVSVVHLRMLTSVGYTGVRSFDQASGLHRLEDGRSVDLTQAFSRGLIASSGHCTPSSHGQTGRESARTDPASRPLK
eukprot:CAMPEP_0179021018 /NCGR_PEP_ID=MMETSP0796-20121207/5674_1 /TAXON_ID=73915 /ORGANISM="Pyrodinium bahamense, Strain pbaha01" /LENGTH=521 /DNA_ID=CAMNT_0020716837 /DNA_START=14 /DNA_END=1577 /DNA_ORIENTATION=+